MVFICNFQVNRLPVAMCRLTMAMDLDGQYHPVLHSVDPGGAWSLGAPPSSFMSRNTVYVIREPVVT